MALVKYNNNSISAVTSAASIPSGALTHIKTLTASSSATLSFVDGSDGVVLDNTYPIYKFEFINIHPDGDQRDLTFNMSTDSGSNYNVVKTTTWFEALHFEGEAAASVAYNGNADLAQSTAFQTISSGLGGSDDDNCNGEITLFNPSSTTFVKHFLCTASSNYRTGLPGEINSYIAGYANTTSAINAFQFKLESGNIASGKIKLYGIKDS